MKKLLCAFLGALTLAVSALGLTACGGNENGAITVYAPDGAPALALAQLMSVEADFGKNVSYKIVDATEIASHVTYKDETKNADLCILPVNDASKLLGDGARYKMLGAVTHGNLYFVSGADKPNLTKDNLKTELSGKKVGVVQMAKFPGAAVKLLLNDYEILNGVTLQGVTPQEVGAASDCDYFVMPEPAATTKVNAAGLKIAGSMQQLYGDGNGYPQAVLVAKNSLIQTEPEFIEKFTKSLAYGSEWLLSESVSAEDILGAIKAHYPDPENTAPSFTAAQLSKTVIANCAVRFEKSAACKTEVQIFLSKLKAVNADFADEVSNDFFYTA